LLHGSFKRPFAVDKAHVSQMVLAGITHGTLKFAHLILKFKNTVAAVDDKKLIFNLARFVVAIAEPT